MVGRYRGRHLDPPSDRDPVSPGAVDEAAEAAAHDDPVLATPAWTLPPRAIPSPREQKAESSAWLDVLLLAAFGLVGLPGWGFALLAVATEGLCKTPSSCAGHEYLRVTVWAGAVAFTVGLVAVALSTATRYSSRVTALVAGCILLACVYVPFWWYAG